MNGDSKEIQPLGRTATALLCVDQTMIFSVLMREANTRLRSDYSGQYKQKLIYVSVWKVHDLLLLILQLHNHTLSKDKNIEGSLDRQRLRSSALNQQPGYQFL